MSLKSVMSKPAVMRIDSERLNVPLQLAGEIERSSGLSRLSSFLKKLQRSRHFITSGAIKEVKSASDEESIPANIALCNLQSQASVQLLINALIDRAPNVSS